MKTHLERVNDKHFGTGSRIRRRPGKLLSVILPHDMSSELRGEAKRRGITISLLVRTYLSQGLMK